MLTTECPRCGATDDLVTDDLVTWLVAGATHWEPEEWENGCVQCAPCRPRDREDDDSRWDGRE